MDDKRFTIKEKEYFSAYRENMVFGVTPKEILEDKLFSLGYYYDESGLSVPEDIFYCPVSFIGQYMKKRESWNLNLWMTQYHITKLTSM